MRIIFKYIYEVVILLVEIAIAVIGLYNDAAIRIYGDPYTALRYTLTYQIAAFVVYIVIKLSVMNSEITEKNEKYHQSISKICDDFSQMVSCTSVVEAIGQEAFYQRFSNQIKEASAYVCISHLDVNPPNPLEKSVQASYYQGLFQVIKTKKNVYFHRIERVSADKIEWLQKLTKELSNCKNFNLHCLLCDDNSPHLPAISVQLVDDTNIYLVAISKHSDATGPRDIYIKDRGAFLLWKEYCENILIKKSLHVVKDGKLVTKNWEKVLKFAEG